MAQLRVVRSSKEIMGVDDYVGAEWDAGYVPIAASHRRCRVTVRKDASDKFSVYCVASRGDTKLASWDIKTFPCETCAKAFSLCLVFGDDYAACRVHDRDGFVMVICLMVVSLFSVASWVLTKRHIGLGAITLIIVSIGSFVSYVMGNLTG